MFLSVLADQPGMARAGSRKIARRLVNAGDLRGEQKKSTNSRLSGSERSFREMARPFRGKAIGNGCSIPF